MLHQNNDIEKNTFVNKKENDLLKVILDVIQHVLILITFLMFFSFVQVAMAAAEDNQNALLLYSTGSNESRSAAMVRTDVDMRVSGMINHTLLTQVFKNSRDEWVEGIYQFTLPESVVVDTLRIQMGERVIYSEIKSNARALTQYQNAKKTGKRTALLEQHRANIFSSKIANIAPGEEVRIEISFQYLVKYEQGEFKLRFPMAMLPRYLLGVTVSEWADFDPSILNGLNENQLANTIRLRYPVTGSDKPVPVSLHIELDAGFPLVELDSRYHAIHKTNHGSGRYSIRFKSGIVLSKRDFELFWRPEPGQRPRTSVFHEKLGDEHYYFAMLYPPQPELSDQTLLNKEVVYVIDTSGSMAGVSIRQARDAMLTALDDLDPEDFFNIITFNTQTHSLFKQSRPASVLNVARARQFIALTNARGGTEMLPALKKALAYNESDARLRQIIYLTDGAVVNEQEVFELLRKNIQQNRLFTIGIGPSPNSYFLHNAARIGRGTYTYISNINEVSMRLGKFLKKINRPVLQNIKIEHLSGKAEVVPQNIPDLYAYEPVVFSMKANEPVGVVNIVGYRADEQWSRRLQLTDSNNGFGVAKYWARQKIKAYLDASTDMNKTKKLEKSITAIALKHKIMSPYTSLVVVDKSLTGNPSKRIYSHPIPARLTSMQNMQVKTGQVIPLLAKTATDTQLKFIVGLVSLLLAVLVRIFLRRRYQNREWL